VCTFIFKGNWRQRGTKLNIPTPQKWCTNHHGECQASQTQKQHSQLQSHLQEPLLWMPSPSHNPIQNCSNPSNKLLKKGILTDPETWDTNFRSGVFH
jgi:hypothetical protein